MPMRQIPQMTWDVDKKINKQKRKQMNKCKNCKKPCDGKYCSKKCEKECTMKEATEKVCKECGKPITKGKYCKRCEKAKMQEGAMPFKDMVKSFLNLNERASRKSRGIKAMASSAGLSPAEEKRETHKLESKGVMSDIKKRAKGATNPNAYIYGTERKILKQHAAKMRRGG
jgi:hypothetical protein